MQMVLLFFLLLSINSDFLTEFEKTQSIESDIKKLKERVKKENINSKRRHEKRGLI